MPEAMGVLSFLRLVAVVGVIGCAACGDAAGQAFEVRVDDLPCEMERPGGIWESAPPPPITIEECLWFPFEANNTYIFEHPLGRVPSFIIGYIAFSGDGRGATIASGDAFLVNGADESTVTIRNGQNQSFSLRLVLQ